MKIFGYEITAKKLPEDEAVFTGTVSEWDDENEPIREDEKIIFDVVDYHKETGRTEIRIIDTQLYYSFKLSEISQALRRYRRVVRRNHQSYLKKQRQKNRQKGW